jgi:hypothetical protein
MNIRKAVAVLALSMMTATAAKAQGTAQFGLEAGVFHSTLGGDDFEGTEGGIGFEFQAKMEFSSGFGIGAGFMRSSHDLDVISENLVVSGFFAEPRYMFSSQGTIRPFLTGRVGILTQSVEDASDEAEGPGTLIGFGGGLGINASPTIDILVSATYNMLSFGDIEVNGFEIPDSDSKGNAVLLRAGVSLKLGGR